MEAISMAAMSARGASSSFSERFLIPKSHGQFASSSSSERWLIPKSHGQFPKTLLSPAAQPLALRFCHREFQPARSGGNGDFGSGNVGGDGGGGGGGGDDDGDSSGGKNRREAILLLAEMGRSLESLPSDLAKAVDAGRIPPEIVRRFLDLEKSGLIRWLLGFAVFRERLLADDLFLAKVAMECGVGIFTKTLAESQRRGENFTKELDIVFAHVVTAIVADFMLVWLPAPTISLRPPIALNAGPISNFFYSCPDNAFQIALGGSSYSVLQRVGAILRNGSKLFVVGTHASLIGTGITNALIKTRRPLDENMAGESEGLPILSTSVAFGVYMAVASNIRYQVLAGVLEQRILEPLLHNDKLLLSASCFVARTGNIFLGSLLWMKYARWIGIHGGKRAKLDRARSSSSLTRNQFQTRLKLKNKFAQAQFDLIYNNSCTPID